MSTLQTVVKEGVKVSTDASGLVTTYISPKKREEEGTLNGKSIVKVFSLHHQEENVTTDIIFRVCTEVCISNFFVACGQDLITEACGTRGLSLKLPRALDFHTTSTTVTNQEEGEEEEELALVGIEYAALPEELEALADMSSETKEAKKTTNQELEVLHAFAEGLQHVLNSLNLSFFVTPDDLAFDKTSSPPALVIKSFSVGNGLQQLLSERLDVGSSSSDKYRGLVESTVKAFKPYVEQTIQLLHGSKDKRLAAMCRYLRGAADMWLFGYGSLLWKQNFPFAGAPIKSYVKGFVRYFSQGSTDHRGVPGKPGRVVTLEPAPQGQVESARVYGLTFRVSEANKPAVIAALDIREKGGYERHMRFTYSVQYDSDGKVVTDDDQQQQPPGTTPPQQQLLSFPSLVYIANVTNEEYLGLAPIPVMANQIMSSFGPSGPNRDYLFNMVEGLRVNDLLQGDQHLMDLEVACKKILESEVHQ